MVKTVVEQDNDTDLRLRRLMRAAQEGDSVSYDHLLRELVPIIRGIIHRRSNFPNTEDTEDLVQEVLLSIHAVRATYDPDRSFIPWLMAIVRNRIADRARQYSRSQAVRPAIEQFYETFRPSKSNINEEGKADPERLRHAIRELPDGQRRAIELLKMKGMSLKEASRETGMSVAALKVAVHRAIKTLRRVLKT